VTSHPRSRRGTPDPVGSRSRKRRRSRARARRRRNVAVLLVAAVLVTGGAVAATGLGGAAAIGEGCDLKRLRPVEIGANSFVYAADGSLLGSIPAERNREPVTLAQINPWLIKATVAIEDRRFYEHGGVDPEGIARAVIADLRARKVVQGGSTITQQLVRNLYIGKERTFKRKLIEACLAVKLSRQHSKDWILRQYLDTVYYGSHAYGAEAAAQTYFSRHARSLKLEQAALLAGLPQAPSEFDPFRRPKAALERRNAVLDAMYENGDLALDLYRAARGSRRLGLKAGKVYTRIREPYFFSFVRDQLIDEYGAETVRSGGLRVYTTINPRFQKAANKAIRDTLYLKDDPAAALVSINPANGAIRAMTAVTPGKKGNQFNLVAQARRQAGSTFKAFVLTTAVAQGVNPATTTYVSAPFHYQPDPYSPAWDVHTYDGSYYGVSTIEQATLRSDNTIYAQLTVDLGPANVAAMAHKLGIRTPLPPYPSMGLGAIAVSPLELASAYATIAARGVYSRPMAIRRVVFPDGKEDADAGWGKPRRTRVIPDGVAYEVTRILEENVLGGTGVGAYFGRPAAGKTGTTDNHADAWFCGFTPNLETTVWVGYPRGEIPMLSVHGIAVAGGTFPATIWHQFMEAAIGSTPPLDWTPPMVYPLWRPFERGQYAIPYVPSPPPAPPASSSSESTSTTAPEPSQPEETPPAPPPPSTTAPTTTETVPAPTP
jgi:penicillin-binding protein 1A